MNHYYHPCLCDQTYNIDCFSQCGYGLTRSHAPDAPFLYSNGEPCNAPFHAVEPGKQTNEKRYVTRYQDIHTKTNSLICAAIQRERQPMLSNKLTPALTPLCYDHYCPICSRAKQLLRLVNALRREVILMLFERWQRKRVVSQATVTAMG